MTLKKILDKIEGDIGSKTMLELFQIGITLKVLEDMLEDVDDELSRRCNDLQHHIFNDD